MTFDADKRFNTQPPEGGWWSGAVANCVPIVSTHSRPKAAGDAMTAIVNGRDGRIPLRVSTHSRPKAAEAFNGIHRMTCQFQHTAARRRLLFLGIQQPASPVSTHSRPKAAAISCINACPVLLFQHTAARRRLPPFRTVCTDYSCFNTQPPEGG